MPKESLLDTISVKKPMSALYLPVEYEDFRPVITRFDRSYLFEGGQGVFSGRITGHRVKWKNKRCQTTFSLSDGLTEVKFTLFGDTRKFVERLETEPNVFVKGVVTFLDNTIFLHQAKVVLEEYVDRVLPVYPKGKGKMAQRQALAFADMALAHIETGAMHIMDALGDEIVPLANIHQRKLEQALKVIHQPNDIEQARFAHQYLLKVAYLIAARSVSKDKVTEHTLPMSGMAIPTITACLPFALTESQQQCVESIIGKMQQGERVNGLINGDVGSGKTAVFSCVTRFVVSSGGRVGILMPSQALAEQVHQEFGQWYGEDLCQLITGQTQNIQPNKPVLIGTTALLFRAVSDFNLVIVDEQQRMSVEQREAFTGPNTHRLDVSATPIPRTMALAEFGHLDVYRIEGNHSNKTITTKLNLADDADMILKRIEYMVAKGFRTLIVCPKRDDTGAGNATIELQDAEDLAAKFETIFPNNVALMHSGLSDEQNSAALTQTKEGERLILISTTVVEVGITIPDLRLLVVYQADRFGLQTLHQLRGRLARNGGRGHCDLFCPNPIKDKTRERLEIIERTNDGFEIAELDMQLRGVGDIGGNKAQHGETKAELIQNVVLKPEKLAQSVAWVKSITGESSKVA